MDYAYLYPNIIALYDAQGRKCDEDRHKQPVCGWCGDPATRQRASIAWRGKLNCDICAQCLELKEAEKAPQSAKVRGMSGTAGWDVTCGKCDSTALRTVVYTEERGAINRDVCSNCNHTSEEPVDTEKHPVKAWKELPDASEETKRAYWGRVVVQRALDERRT